MRLFLHVKMGLCLVICTGLAACGTGSRNIFAEESSDFGFNEDFITDGVENNATAQNNSSSSSSAASTTTSRNLAVNVSPAVTAGPLTVSNAVNVSNADLMEFSNRGFNSRLLQRMPIGQGTATAVPSGNRSLLSDQTALNSSLDTAVSNTLATANSPLSILVSSGSSPVAAPVTNVLGNRALLPQLTTILTGPN
ncbi:MAG: hypothetical protein JWM96_200 [Alphaproteobacteria bacterium]|nr:hypothetical protein [Alphaproteobacteria bacterium]